MKLVKIQQLCFRSSVHEQLAIDIGKRIFYHSSVLVLFSTQYRFSACFLANEISHVVCWKSVFFFQLMFVLEIFDCTIYNQPLLKHFAIIFNSGITSISRNILQWRLPMFYLFPWRFDYMVSAAVCKTWSM